MSTTHVHLLLKFHVRTVGFLAMAIGFSIVVPIARSDLLKQVSLVAFVGIALVVIPTYVTGNAAAQKLCVSERHAPCADVAIPRPRIQCSQGAAVLFLAVFL